VPDLVIPTSKKTISTKNVASNKQKNPVNGKPSKEHWYSK